MQLLWLKFNVRSAMWEGCCLVIVLLVVFCFALNQLHRSYNYWTLATRVRIAPVVQNIEYCCLLSFPEEDSSNLSYGDE